MDGATIDMGYCSLVRPISARDERRWAVCSLHSGLCNEFLLLCGLLSVLFCFVSFVFSERAIMIYVTGLLRRVYKIFSDEKNRNLCPD